MLTIQQIKERLESPKNRTAIQRAKNHEDRLRFHGEVILNQSEASTSFTEFANYVKKLLPESKYVLFLAFFRFPVFTNEILDKVFNFFRKIFQGRDPFYHVSFSSETYKSDWLAFKAKLFPVDYWESVAYEVMKTRINSIQIVDLAPSQDSENPEPYHYFLGINDVFDFDERKGLILDLLMIHKDKLYVFDDESYRVFDLNEDNEIVGEAIVDNPHDLKYCPCRFFWSDNLNSKSDVVKKFETSNQLSNLDDTLFTYYKKEHLDLTSAFPIHYGLEVECDYENTEMNQKCNKGFLVDNAGNYLIGSEGVHKCPVCSDKRIAGAGTYVEINYPDDENDVKMYGTPPVGKVDVDIDALKFHTEELERKSSNVYVNVTGDTGSMPDQAINRFQVGAMVDGMKTNILRVQSNFEAAQLWSESTICKLRYGDKFKSMSISYGTEHYMYSLDHLTTLYQEAKKSGASESDLDSFQDQITELENKNNPQALRRAKLLKQIEPYRHLSKYELLEAYKDQPILFDQTMVKIKVDFSNLVARFEREVIPIEQFGINISYAERVNLINNKLKSYVNS